MMSTIKRRLKSSILGMLIRGWNRQNFLGAPWIRILLYLTPGSKKYSMALRILALSPHYFFRDPEHHGPRISTSRFLEMERKRNDDTRGEICRQVLLPYLEKSYAVLDYGCGPGFLARHVSGYVDQVYGCDISPGTIACARIISPAENLVYFVVGGRDPDPIKSASLDLIYSFAVIQHISDDLFRKILDKFFLWLQPGGRGILHIVVDDEGWRTEDEWREDRSALGKIKYRYGLHCFGRKEEEVRGMIRAAGFVDLKHLAIADICDIDDDIVEQSLFVFIKPESNIGTKKE